MTINLMPFLKKVHSLWFIVRGHKKTINYQPSTINRNSTGFTLIELLVVIAIIGILASLATFTYTDSQKKSRDSRRKTDLEAIRKAMELAKQDSAGSYTYPSCDTYSSGSCGVNDATGNSSSTDTGGVVPDLIGTNYSYIKAVPKDPKSGSDYTYTPLSASCAAATCTTFSIYACLENTKDTQKDDVDGGASDKCVTPTAVNGLVSYTISNL